MYCISSVDSLIVGLCSKEMPSKLMGLLVLLLSGSKVTEGSSTKVPSPGRSSLLFVKRKLASKGGNFKVFLIRSHNINNLNGWCKCTNPC